MSDAAREAVWWNFQLTSAMDHPYQSAERAAAVNALAGTVVMDWTNRPRKLARATLYAKLEAFEERGIGALSRSRRVDTGQSKVMFSRAWDKAVPFDEDTKRKVAHAAKQELRGWIAAGTARKIALVLTREFLKAQTVAFGFRPNDLTEFDRICTVSTTLYQANIHFSKNHRHRSDRKASFDAEPVVNRHIRDAFPSSTIVADVHHCNVLVAREDGTTATPKLIAFYDIATHRVWVETVFFEGRGGVRNVDMIEAFVALAANSSWGLPQIFYCDNGTENLFSGYLDDALKLTATDMRDGWRSSGTLRALPYRGRSKPIERWFGHFEQQFLSTLQGYIGDNRMSPKQQAIGKMPAPFPGGIEAFNATVQALLLAYHALPQQGQLGGKSPNQAFAAFVDKGWRATVIDPDNLLSVFTKPEPRMLRNHGFSLDGRSWNCAELDAYHGDRVIVRVPQLGIGFNSLRVETEAGEFIGTARPEEEFSYHDPRGAKKSAERRNVRNRSLRDQAASVPAKDPATALIRYGTSQMPVVANDPGGVVRVGTEAGADAIIPTHQPEVERTDARREEWERAQFMIENLGRKRIPK